MGAVLCRGSGESLDAENEQFDVFTTTSVTAGVAGARAESRGVGQSI